MSYTVCNTRNHCIFLQFLTDADDVDTGMLDFLRLISSDDIGKDESNVQMLLKVHDNISKDLNDYTSVIDALQVLFLNSTPTELASLELVIKLCTIVHVSIHDD